MADADTEVEAARTVPREAAVLRFDALEAGDALPPLAVAPVTRLQLALFASAAADPNPIHVDDAAAQAAGLPGAIVHGMLTMAFLGRLLTGAVPLRALRALDGRFVAMAFPGDTITCTGTIAGKSIEQGERRVAIDLVAQNQRGEPLVTGKAIVALP
jgi:acyl dehydratase